MYVYIYIYIYTHTHTHIYTVRAEEGGRVQRHCSKRFLTQGGNLGDSLLGLS